MYRTSSQLGESIDLYDGEQSLTAVQLVRVCALRMNGMDALATNQLSMPPLTILR